MNGKQRRGGTRTSSSTPGVTRRAVLVGAFVALAPAFARGKEEVFPIALAYAFDGPLHPERLVVGSPLEARAGGRYRYLLLGNLVLGCVPPGVSDHLIPGAARKRGLLRLKSVRRDPSGRLCLEAVALAPPAR